MLSHNANLVNLCYTTRIFHSTLMHSFRLVKQYKYLQVLKYNLLCFFFDFGIEGRENGGKLGKNEKGAILIGGAMLV